MTFALGNSVSASFSPSLLFRLVGGRPGGGPGALVFRGWVPGSDQSPGGGVSTFAGGGQDGGFGFGGGLGGGFGGALEPGRAFDGARHEGSGTVLFGTLAIN